jgi:hypothetical protein
MNADRRQALDRLIDPVEGIDGMIADLGSILKEEIIAFGDMPKGLRNSFRGIRSSRAMNAMQRALESLEEAKAHIEEAKGE